jgi:hypothetical protein
LAKELMINRTKINFAEKFGKLLKVGMIAPYGVGGDIPRVLQIGEETDDMLLHGDTVAYRAVFCKGRGERQGTYPKTRGYKNFSGEQISGHT